MKTLLMRSCFGKKLNPGVSSKYMGYIYIVATGNIPLKIIMVSARGEDHH